MEITPRQLELIEAASKILTKSGTSGLTKYRNWKFWSWLGQ